MAEVLDEVDWQGKVFSSGWTVPQGGELKSVEPATGEVLGRVGLANAADISAAAAVAHAGAARMGYGTGPERAALPTQPWGTCCRPARPDGRASPSASRSASSA
jgi:hypothetical protein